MTQAMNDADVRAFCRRWGLSQRGLAELLGVGDRTAQRWCEGGQDIPGPAMVAMRLIDELGRLPPPLRPRRAAEKP